MSEIESLKNELILYMGSISSRIKQLEGELSGIPVDFTYNPPNETYTLSWKRLGKMRRIFFHGTIRGKAEERPLHDTPFELRKHIVENDLEPFKSEILKEIMNYLQKAKGKNE